jgi:HEAT repeat protein
VAFVVVLLAILVAQEPSALEPLFAKIATYEYGSGREHLAAVTRQVTESIGSPARRKEIEARLLALAESQATAAAKDFALRELSRIGSETSIARLKALAAKADTAEMARYAMARISDSAAAASAPRAAPAKPVAALVAEMQSAVPLVRATAIRLLSEMPGATITKTIVEQYAKLPPAGQVVLLVALADRGDRAAAPLFTSTARSGEGEVRIAALSGLGKLGDESNVELLAEIAATTQGPQQAAAREALYSLRGERVDKAIVAALGAAPGRVKVELIMAAGERGIAAASTLLIAAVGEKDPDVHREALRALRYVAGVADVPALLQLLLRAATAADRRESAQTLASVLRRSGATQIELVVAAYDQTPSNEARLALIEVMGQASSDVAVPLLRALLGSPDSAIARAAILALTEWASPAPMADLLPLAREHQNPALQILALRGYLRLVALPSPRPPTESARLLGEAMSLARQAAEKRTILSMLANFACKEALEVAQAATKDRDVAEEAAAVVDRLNGLLKFL